LFNQALMELGALVCHPRAPACTSACPLTACCRAYAAGTVSQRPVPIKKPAKLALLMACGIIEHQGTIYIQQRLADDIWGGLWEFPGGLIKEGESPEQAAVREIAEETEFHVTALRPFAVVHHNYTNHRVTLHSFLCRLADGQSTEPILHAASQFCWLHQDELARFAFPAGHRQLLAKLTCP